MPKENLNNLMKGRLRDDVVEIISLCPMIGGAFCFLESLPLNLPTVYLNGY
jgi:hypothetical protein